MKTILMIVAIAILTTGCSTKWGGYRGTPLPPQNILENHPTYPEILNDPSVGEVTIAKLPFKPTEYRTVWIEAHKNEFGDAVDGHWCRVVFTKAGFVERKRLPQAPTAPIIVKDRPVKSFVPDMKQLLGGIGQ